MKHPVDKNLLSNPYSVILQSTITVVIIKL